jgi:hypothetical protein
VSQGRGFERALADCLAALDRGEFLDDVLSRYPRHARAVREALQVRTRLEHRALPVPPAAFVRGEQRLDAALRSAARPRGRARLALLSQAAAYALVAFGVALGAAGASAVAGGPNLPEAALRAVSAAIDVALPGSGPDAPQTGSNEGTSGGITSAATSTSTAAAEPGVLGLCNALLAGGLGQQGKGHPEALTRLAEAAGVQGTDSDAIESYCATVTSKGATPTSTPGAPDGKGASDEHRQDQGTPPGQQKGQSEETPSKGGGNQGAGNGPPETPPGKAPDSPPGKSESGVNPGGGRPVEQPGSGGGAGNGNANGNGNGSGNGNQPDGPPGRDDDGPPSKGGN